MDRKLVLNDMEITLLSEIFSIFADPTRIQTISALLDGEMTVTEIQEAISLSQSATSHQLKLLKSARVVKSRRDGRKIYYSIDDHHIAKILLLGVSHIRKDDCDE